ncbi:hypothetical protein C8R42DRAFT_410308 [Lentinula raphanica]|nr:hypothetical protein C8R42DRAFT_410308 [Lentinula raphanica]
MRSRYPIALICGAGPRQAAMSVLVMPNVFIIPPEEDNDPPFCCFDATFPPFSTIESVGCSMSCSSMTPAENAVVSYAEPPRAPSPAPLVNDRSVAKPALFRRLKGFVIPFLLTSTISAFILPLLTSSSCSSLFWTSTEHINKNT